MRCYLQMCNSAVVDYFCDIRISNAVITKLGGFLDCSSLMPYSLSDPSIKGNDPLYFPSNNDMWAHNFIDMTVKLIETKFSVSDTLSTGHRPKQKRQKTPISHIKPIQYEIKQYPLVIPLRMKWDDCFNHLSFQTLPLIGHAMELYGSIWDQLYWHASLYSAALLRLLDVPLNRIIIEERVVAKELLLPWIQVHNSLPLSHPLSPQTTPYMA